MKLLYDPFLLKVTPKLA